MAIIWEKADSKRMEYRTNRVRITWTAISCNLFRPSRESAVDEYRLWLFEVRKNPHSPGFEVYTRHCEITVRFLMFMTRQQQLPQVVSTLRSPCGFPNVLHSGEQRRGQEADDRDRYESFDDRKPPLWSDCARIHMHNTTHGSFTFYWKLVLRVIQR